MRVSRKQETILAIHGGRPVRETLLPYAHQHIDEDGIRAVVEVLRSFWITTGPKVAEFEEHFAAAVGAKYAVSFSSGTAAMHGAANAPGISAGDEVITTPLTFCATVNSILYQNATPVFADICPDTLNIDPAAVRRLLTPRTKAVLPVDYAGHPADLTDILSLAERRGMTVIEDACHALGATYRGRRVGSISHMTVFSFHPVKHVTTGEGGMVTTDNPEFARRLRLFRSHGIQRDTTTGGTWDPWYYEMVALGHNYRLTDIACALGLSQMGGMDANLAKRRYIANRYAAALQEIPGITLPAVRPDVEPAWHLYPVRLELEKLSGSRADVFRALQAENIGVNVHYIPVHLHPYYRERFGYRGGEYPVAEDAYQRIISLPMFHGMTDQDAEDVIEAVTKVLRHYAGES